MEGLRETSEQLEQVRAKLAEHTEAMVRNPVLDAVESGKLSEQQWRDFAIQRVLAAQSFLPLLEAGIVLAETHGDVLLAQVLRENRQDELGIDANGRELAVGSHHKWRQDFYQAIGVLEEDLARTVALPETVAYQQSMQDLIASDDLYTVSGALLLQEYSLPAEFKRMQIGRDKTFRGQFEKIFTDTPAVSNQKKAARMYLDHHIGHDAKLHYPDLEGALEQHLEDPEKFAKVLKAMEVLAVAKRNFYQGVGRTLIHFTAQ